MRYRLPGAVGLLFQVGLAAAAGWQSSPANAHDNSGAEIVAAGPHAPAASHKNIRSASGMRAANSATAKRYFVEFRARNAASYGHMYVMYGEVNARREIIRSETAGFFPAGDSRNCVNCSVYNWTIGHVLPVPSEIGASDGDLEEQYVLARFRVWIDAAQYQSLVAYIKERKAHKGLWNAFLNNCVTFGRDVAVFLHLKVPPLIAISPSIVMYPKDVVEALRKANGVNKEQGPLEDAPGSLPADAGNKGQAKARARPAAERPAAEKAAFAASPSKKRVANQRD